MYRWLMANVACLNETNRTIECGAKKRKWMYKWIDVYLCAGVSCPSIIYIYDVKARKCQYKKEKRKKICWRQCFIDNRSLDEKFVFSFFIWKKCLMILTVSVWQNGKQVSTVLPFSSFCSYIYICIYIYVCVYIYDHKRN